MDDSGTRNTRDRLRTTVERAATLWGRRIAPALVAPLGILLTIPILVGGVGLLIWWQGDVAVGESVDSMAKRQFGERAEAAAQHARDLLGHADPLTDNMVAYVRRVGTDPPLREFALHFRDLLRACPGVAYISFGTHEGHYFGVYVDAEDHFVLTHRVYHGPGRTHKRDSFIEDDDSIRPFRDIPDHGFDPRTRPWYLATVQNGRRTWSEPYVWFDIGVVGITCSEPIRDDQGKVIAVTTVDFHLNLLSEFVEGLATQEGERTLIFTRDGDVIAYPGESQEFEQGMAKGSKLKVVDLEPQARAFFAAMGGALATTAGQFAFESGGEGYLAAVRPIALGEDGRWFAATFGPTAPLTAPARAHRRNALLVSGLALVVAILVAAFFARFIVNTHLRIRQAEHMAREADARARRLGSYRLTHKLDEGGMGEVWIAAHDMLARPAAIKLIRPRFLEGRSEAERRVAIERFRHEARTIAGLRSRHTIGIYDFGVADDGALFYVMELLDGVDLLALVKEHGAVPARGVAEILLQATSSLQEAHERGIIHRDIKPANLFLCRQADEVDVVKVLDFGMARRTEGEDAKRTGEDLVGTPAYMSPEQVQGKLDLDGRADIYSLGCVAYWLLAGRHVFLHERPMAVIMAHVSEEPEPVGKVARIAVPPELEAIVMRCLAKGRDERPATMAALGSELADALASLPADGWDPRSRRAWWSGIPNRFDDLGDGRESVQISPRRSTDS